jgi:hypothetical protein
MVKKIVATAVVASAAIATALAQIEWHQNTSLTSYVGFAPDLQSAQSSALCTGSEGERIEAVAFDNPSSLKSFNTKAVNAQPTPFQGAPRVVGNSDFG